MDRRGNTERAAERQDEDLQRALEVILESYRGVAPEQLYRDAIACFESLIETSRNTDMIKDFAHRRGIDLKYLVDGANFVISKMHFNSENNYYITLGLARNSAPDEIRERWKRLMLLYHPDRQPGSEDLVSERAKKVNEAYSVLKDEHKRSVFDKQLAGEMLRQNRGGSAAGLRHASRKPPGPFSRSQGSRPEGHLGTVRRYFTKILIALYLLCMGLVAALYIFREGTPELESQLRADDKTSPALTARVPETVKPAYIEPPDSSAGRPKEALIDSLDRFITSGPGADRSAGGRPERALRSAAKTAVDGRTAMPLPEKSRTYSAESGREPANKTSDVSPSQLLKPVLPESTAKQHKGADAAVPAAQNAELPARPEVSQTGRVSEEKKSAMAPVSSAKPSQEPRIRAVAGSRGESITREEAADFISRFIKAYEKSDLETMMSLFSQSAVENDKMRYPEIRSVYRMALEGKINYYELRDMDIRTDGTAAFVAGAYTINRYSSADNRWVKFSGRIHWKLIREQNALKIISLNYDRL